MKTPCPTCAASTRKGLLWLSGGDWLECPDCTDGMIEVIEERFVPKERLVTMPGLPSFVERQFHPAVARFY